MKLALGVVNAGGFADVVPKAFMWSMWALHSEILRGRTPVRGLTLIRSGKFPTDCARNEICREFLKTDFDRLLFLDIDHEFLPDAIVRLLESPHDIVTGRYHVKRPPYHPNLYVFPREAHQPGQFRRVHYGRGVFEIDRCGAGALLIQRHVLERIGMPWFRYGEDAETGDLAISEDFHFCERAQAEGFRIMADWDAELKHLTMGAVDEEWAKQYLDLMEAGLDEKPELADTVIVCGYPDGVTLRNGTRLPPYERPADPVG